MGLTASITSVKNRYTEARLFPKQLKGCNYNLINVLESKQVL